jgi:predicted ATP-grasp superfamily ATP-dependent carboligase/SAM-dependent methyltransferase
MIDTSTPVVVFQAEDYGAVGIMRSLGRWGVKVYGIDPDPAAVGFASRYCAGSFRWDFASAPPEQSVAFLLDVAARVGGRPILIHTGDEAAGFLSKHQAELSRAFRFPRQPDGLVETLYSKREMYRLCKQHGIPTAETLFPQSRDDVVAFLDRVEFPLMLKASDGWRQMQRTGMRMMIVRDRDELLERYDALEDPDHPNLMLQQFIPGEDDSVWMFNGYFDERSECLFGLTGRKLRQYPVHRGMTSLGICLRNDTVAETTARLARVTGYRGIMDIGHRFDRRDGQYKVLDVNARVGVTFRLFVGDDGLDVVRALYLDLTGQPVPRSKIVEGRKWWVEDKDLISCAEYFRERSLTVPSWLRSYRGVSESAYFAADDPEPFVHVVAHWSRRAVGFVGRRTLGRVGLWPKPVDAPVPASRPAQVTQREVDEFFATRVDEWDEIYRAPTVFARVHQDRLAAVLAWVDGLELSRKTRVLDIGCGAGHVAVALARRGFDVNAVDAVPEMVERVRHNARREGVGDRIHVAQGEITSLPFESGSLSLVLCVGVMPWLPAPRAGVDEIARTLAPGGHAVITADHAWRLQFLLDPLRSPLLERARKAVKRAVGRRDDRPVVPQRSRYHRERELHAMVADTGLEIVASRQIGFGPFTFAHREFLPEPVGVRIHRVLQRGADVGVPLLRSTGSQLLVLVRKRAD